MKGIIQKPNNKTLSLDMQPIADAYGHIYIIPSQPNRGVAFAVRTGDNGRDLVSNPEIKKIQGFEIKKGEIKSTLVALKEAPKKAKPKSKETGESKEAKS